MEVVSKAEAARRWELTRAAITKYVAKGMPVREDGQLDWETVDEWRRTYNAPERSGSFAARAAASASEIRPAQPPVQQGFEVEGVALEDLGDGDESRSLAEASRRLEWERVRAAQIKSDREEGRLVALDPVNAYVAGMILKAREELTRIPTEMRDVLAHETDPIRCEELMQRRIEDVLAKMAVYRPPVAA